MQLLNLPVTYVQGEAPFVTFFTLIRKELYRKLLNSSIMDFKDQIKNLANRVETLLPQIQTEEATKNALIMPFIQILGYDVFNPLEVVPEFIADIGIKKGEKVDYAILKEGVTQILIECKYYKEKLDPHNSQLFRYFHVSKARFAILTRLKSKKKD